MRINSYLQNIEQKSYGYQNESVTLQMYQITI